MSSSVAKRFGKCLEEIDRGELTPAECLARHPEQRDELAELFAARAALQAPIVAPRPEFRQIARARLLNRLPAAERVAPGALPRRRSWWWRPAPTALRRATVAGLAALLLILSLTVVAAARALPGDLFYPLKIAAEDARLARADGEEEVALHLKYLQTRTQEIESLARRERQGNVALAVLVYEDHAAGSVDILVSTASHYAVHLAELTATDRVFRETEEELEELLPRFSGPSRSWVERAIGVTASQRGRLSEMFPTTVLSSLALPPGD